MLTYMRPLRIVFDASPLLVNKTGVAYYTERLVTTLAEQYPDKLELVGFYYNFLGRRDTSHLPRRSNLRFTGVHLVPSKIIFQLRRWGIGVPVECLAKARADFVLYPNFLSYPSIFRTPSAPVIHDLTYYDLPEYVAKKNGSDLRRFVPNAIARSQFVLTVSEFSKQRLQDVYHLPASNILVTPIPPVPTRPLSNNERTVLLKKQGITKPYILFLGTVEPRKNLVNLMDAYLQLPEDVRRNYELVLAGGIGWNCGAELAKIAELAGKGVRHLGYVDDATRTALYCGASLFVTASSYEGFGMPVLEAMHHGVPSAVSDIPVFHEVAGNSAHYFDQANPAAIAHTLQGLLGNNVLRTQLGKAGQRRAATLNWPAIATSVYERIVQAVQQ
jgi:alpha-1,3-rhamnosyl/mannosyltransferase